MAKLTRKQLERNDDILDEIENLVLDGTCEAVYLLFPAKEMTPAEDRAEWAHYVKNIKRLKALAAKLKV